MHEAMFSRSLPGNAVACSLCPHHCAIADRKHGLCGVRENRGGTLWSLNYGKVIAAHVDPIEKKPLFHFQPGARAFSVAAAGCNLRCAFCQNWEISQATKGQTRSIDGQHTDAAEVVAAAERAGCNVIAFTYTEPTVFYEWALDVARAAKERNLSNVFVTNGFIEAEPLRHIRGYLDAANVDLKAFREATYREVMGASLKPVLETLRLMKDLGIWVEVTTLVVPQMNDSEEELRDIASFVARDLGPDTPWHVSAFHPDFRYTNAQPTRPNSLRRAADIGREEGLRYVYVGNLPVPGGEDTSCHACGTTLIQREGFHVRANRITSDQSCPRCGARVSGVAMAARV